MSIQLFTSKCFLCSKALGSNVYCSVCMNACRMVKTLSKPSQTSTDFLGHTCGECAWSRPAGIYTQCTNPSATKNWHGRMNTDGLDACPAFIAKGQKPRDAAVDAEGGE